MHRGDRAFALLNKFPYSSGHVMVAPNRHVGDFGELTDEEALEIHRLAERAIDALAETYTPQGYNLGWNLGRIAGAGIARPRPPTRRPALGGGHELHAGARRREGDSGAPRSDAREARGGLAYLSDLESRPNTPRTTSRSSWWPVES